MDHGIAIAGYSAFRNIADMNIPDPDPDAYYAEYGIDHLAAPKRAVRSLWQLSSNIVASFRHIRFPAARLTSDG